MRVRAWQGGLPQGVTLLAMSCGTQLWDAQMHCISGDGKRDQQSYNPFNLPRKVRAVSEGSDSV